MTVIQNSYPQIPGIAHAEPGDVVAWELRRGRYSLIRRSDGKTVFSTGDVDKDGNLRSSGLPPILDGCIASIKSKGHFFIIRRTNDR